jgi:hypothetical protein
MPLMFLFLCYSCILCVSYCNVVDVSVSTSASVIEMYPVVRNAISVSFASLIAYLPERVAISHL